MKIAQTEGEKKTKTKSQHMLSEVLFMDRIKSKEMQNHEEDMKYVKLNVTI